MTGSDQAQFDWQGPFDSQVTVAATQADSQQQQQQQPQQLEILNSGRQELGRRLKRLIVQQRSKKLAGGSAILYSSEQFQRRQVMQPQVYVVGSPTPKSPFLRIAHISDTCEASDHGISAIYNAEVLVHTGNLCSYQFSKHFFKDTEFQNQIKAINEFFSKMPHKYKIFVAGPNEIFDAESREKIQALLPHCIYLQDSHCIIEGVKFYGTPWAVARRGIDGRGFVKPHSELKTVWSNIPDDVDVMVSPTVPTNSLYEELVARIRPKLFLYGVKQERSSRSDPQQDENCVKFKDNVIFANGHVTCSGRRGLFDFYADARRPRETLLPDMEAPDAPSEAPEAPQPTPQSRRRHSLLSCIQS